MRRHLNYGHILDFGSTRCCLRNLSGSKFVLGFLLVCCHDVENVQIFWS
jgi:hypothetical protein